MGQLMLQGNPQKRLTWGHKSLCSGLEATRQLLPLLSCFRLTAQVSQIQVIKRGDINVDCVYEDTHWSTPSTQRVEKQTAPSGSVGGRWGYAIFVH